MNRLTVRLSIVGAVLTLGGATIAHSMLSQGDAPSAVLLCQQALDNLREDNLPLRCVAAHALGESCRHSGDMAGAEQANESPR